MANALQTDGVREADHQATVGRLCGPILHRLANELAALKMRLQMLPEGDASTSGVAELRDELLEMVDAARSTSHVLARYMVRRADEVSPVAFDDQLELVATLLEPELTSRQLRLDVHIDDPLPVVWGYSSHLRQVLTALVLNAAEAEPCDGVIRVSLMPDGPAHVRLEVADRGTGLRPELLGRCWEPFETSRTEHAGLGLAAARVIVRDHGGSIAIESDPGSGSTVVVRLPQGSHDTPEGSA